MTAPRRALIAAGALALAASVSLDASKHRGAYVPPKPKSHAASQAAKRRRRKIAHASKRKNRGRA